MPSLKKFVVTPSLPAKLKPLLDIARNIWWTWDTEAIFLLRRVDPDLWDKFNHNPIAVLGSLSAERVDAGEATSASTPSGSVQSVATAPRVPSSNAATTTGVRGT